MTQSTELWVDRQDLRKTRIVSSALPTLADGEVLVAIDQFVDIAPHRQALPALYNSYRRTAAEPEFLRTMEVERCLLFPLFATSWLIYDYLVDNDFFGARQVLIGSVSSKTGFGLAEMLHKDPEVTQHIIGLTSPANVAFVDRLGCCDEIIAYGEEANIEATVPSAYVDMSGDVQELATLWVDLLDNKVSPNQGLMVAPG